MQYTPRWWQWLETAPQKTVQCNLCFHACHIPLGKSGFCNARYCGEAGLESPYLGQFSSIAVDPIEKKPLYHWRPNTSILSLGSLGCTMHCPFCQNYSIAQPTVSPPLQAISPEDLLAHVTKLHTPSVAFTYNEPILQAEYILQVAPLLKKAGIAIVLVTNGMIAEAPLTELLPFIDAVNIDVKTFSAHNYATLGGSLNVVKNTVSRFIHANVHVELTTLVVPHISDNLDTNFEMVQWIASFSPYIPLHYSRYFPAHKCTEESTKIELLQALQTQAKQLLHYVHIGNVPSNSSLSK